MTVSPDRIPVIVGVADLLERPTDFAQAREPLALMAAALRAAEDDAGAKLIAAIDSIDLVNQVSWPYTAPAELLCDSLGIKPARAVYGVVGGESPVRLIHEAGQRIARGESQVAAIVGAESQNSVDKARKAGVELPWTAPSTNPQNILRGIDFVKDAALNVGAFMPMTIYPFYETATAAHWGQTPRQALAETGELWARFSEVAAQNPNAWLGRAHSAAEITTPSAANRPLAWPYTKLMVANPTVNQGAAVIVTSLAAARAAGIAEDRMVYLHGGATAAEPRDYLQRDVYYHSTAQDAVLHRAQAIAGGAFGAIELYSCFPCVPKMARRTLGYGTDVMPTVTGGLTFFGAPLNTYMTHAAVAMVHHLRSAGGNGLLYGQGEFVTKHHALVLGMAPPADDTIASDYSVQDVADAARGPVPPFVETMCDMATIEAYTVIFDRDGEPTHGVVIVTDDDGRRAITKVAGNDRDAISRLMDLDQSVVGERGEVAPAGKAPLEFRFT